MTDELKVFVDRALGMGLAKGQIEPKLLEAGWARDEVADALAAYADVEFQIPVPRPRPYVSAREAFVYLVLFLTLYTSAVAWIRLLFELVHYVFPDPASGTAGWRSAQGAIRWSAASMLIAFPVFLWLSRSTDRAVRRNPEKRRSRIRKWLIYLTLFVAAATLLCNLITLVYTVLGGELTVRFLLKVLAVGAVAGAVFGFYLWHVRHEDVDRSVERRHSPGRVFAAVVVAAAAVSLISSLIVAGSPGEARRTALDEQRVQDLVAIAREVDLYWRSKGRLPSTLEELRVQRGAFLRALWDPATGEAYEYRSIGGSTYELCAVFDEVERMEEPAPYGTSLRFWAHDAGRHCFQLEADTVAPPPRSRPADGAPPPR